MPISKVLKFNYIFLQPCLELVTLSFNKSSLIAQLIKDPSAIQETWVLSLGWEDPLKKGMATHLSSLAWRIAMDSRAGLAAVHGVAKSWT